MIALLNTIQQVCFMELWHSILPLLDFITHTKLGDTVPLDILAHLFSGILLCIFLLKMRIPFYLVFSMIFLLALGKEAIDYTRMVEVDYFESLKDIAVTLAYPLILSMARWRKKKYR